MDKVKAALQPVLDGLKKPRTLATGIIIALFVVGLLIGRYAIPAGGKRHGGYMHTALSRYRAAITGEEEREVETDPVAMLTGEEEDDDVVEDVPAAQAGMARLGMVDDLQMLNPIPKAKKAGGKRPVNF